jgi:uncharacterized membrane protein YqiK
MQRLGIQVDSLQIDEIVDSSKYIEKMRKKAVAQVDAEARIAEAENERRAVEVEEETAILNAIARRNSSVEIARLSVEMEAERARADAAYDESAARARQAVVREQTSLAEQEAGLEEARLAACVRKPAEAAAFSALTEARAQADAVKLRGEADAEAIRAKASALAVNSDAVILQQLIEAWPEIVQAAAGPISEADNLVILNGDRGVSDLLVGAITRGALSLDTLRGLLPKLSESAAPVAQSSMEALPKDL